MSLEQVLSSRACGVSARELSKSRLTHETHLIPIPFFQVARDDAASGDTFIGRIVHPVSFVNIVL